VNCGCCGGNIIDNIVIMDNKMKVKDTCSIKILRGKTGKVIDKDGNMRYFVADFDGKGSWIHKDHLSK
jgi:hypothetical protein